MAIKITYQNTDFFVGDTLKVNYKIKEKDKERIQAFDGTLIAIKGKKGTQTIVVKKSASDNVTVERIFSIESPLIDSIKKVRSPKRKIRRSKLYYLRDSKARKI